MKSEYIFKLPHRVRQAAVQGAKRLLSTPNSHVYLRKVLPRLADRLHDSSEAVRAAMLDLLLSVKGVRGGEEHWQGCADSLCNWRRAGELLEVVFESLKAGLTQGKGRGTENSKGVRFQTKGAEEEIGLGVRLLAYLVSHNINRTALLIKEKEKLGEVAEVLLKKMRTFSRLYDSII